MSAMNDVSVFRDVLTRLQKEPGALPWSERRDLARKVVAAVKSGTSTTEAMALAPLLASDTKWEVRLATAEVLPFLPDRQFKDLREVLSSDGNNYVLAAVEKAVASRLSKSRVALKSKKSKDHVAAGFNDLELAHGKAIAKKAQHLCDKHAEALVGSMVHDLRSALTPLKANCTALISERTTSNSSRHQTLGARIETNFKLIEGLLVDVVAFTGSTESPRRPEQLSQVVANAHEMARTNLEQIGFRRQHVQVSVQVPEELIVHIAQNQIVLALANVLKNAYESFVGDGDELRSGKIEVTAALQAGRIELLVRDNGMGMSDDEKRALQFFNPGNRNKSKRQSTGYGLPVAWRYITAHDGTISIESQENVGTTVKITLPFAE